MTTAGKGRAILPDDRARIRAALREWADAGSFHGLRTRALILLVWGSALRLSEALALELGQVLERAPTSPKRLGRVRSTGYLRAEQSKKHKGEGPFVVTKAAREALRAYLSEAIARGWIPTDEPAAALFVTVKGNDHARMGKRAAQYSWQQAQERARVAAPYRFHDLRHDALTRFSDQCEGNPFKVATFGRIRDVRTASTYVHADPLRLAKLAELADNV